MRLAPDYLEPVRAWRTWLVVADGGRLRLRSVVFPTVWLPARPAVSECFRKPSLLERMRTKARRHDAPAETCACGIYGASLGIATTYLTTPANGRHVVGRAIGVVSLWGHVVECEAGWRASRAYPEHLFVSSRGTQAERLLDGLGAYGVPVDVLDAERRRDISAALRSFDPLPRGTA